jgi:uncharacterized protein
MERGCVVCAACSEPHPLHRFALDGDRVVADPTQTLPGRGAYVCSTRCLEDAIRRHAFPRAYRRPVVLDEELPTSIGQ